MEAFAKAELLYALKVRIVRRLEMPNLAGMNVLTLNEAGTAYACLLHSGQKMWSYASGSVPGCSLAVAEDYFLICNMNHKIHAVEARSTGRQ